MRTDLNQYVLFVITNKCNNRCNFCSIGGGDGALTDLLPVSMSFFKKFLKVISCDQYPGIIFSGGEPTLNAKLPEYASYAREKGFNRIMIQTNGIALSDIRFARELKIAGINQIFFSFHSIDKDVLNRISGKTESHTQRLKALENLEKLGLEVISNTVMSSLNYRELPAIAMFLKKFRNIVETHFWGYTPMSSRADELVLPYASAAPYLYQAIKCVSSGGRDVCVKYFPICLLDRLHRKYHRKDLPYRVGVKKSFDERGGRCGFKRCPSCKWADCWGLPEIYRKTMPPGSWMPAPLKD